MSIKPPTAPKYRHYKPIDFGVVRINGRDIYLGKFNSPESGRNTGESSPSGAPITASFLRPCTTLCRTDQP